MKGKKLLLTLATLLLLLGGSFVYFYGGPFRFKRYPLVEAAIERLQAGPQASTPVDAAYEYLYGSMRESDRPKREELEIKARQISAAEARVTVVNRRTQDDSTFVTCDRLTLQQQRDVWIPTRHEGAWQGRGRIGWTTKPTL